MKHKGKHLNITKDFYNNIYKVLKSIQIKCVPVAHMQNNVYKAKMLIHTYKDNKTL